MNLRIQSSAILRQVVDAVEQTSVDIANHAKAGHAGNMAHANGRYRNRTTNLTNSIIPHLLRADYKEVDGIVLASENYAYWVEFGTTVNIRTGLPNRPYPFMQPAIIACNKNFLDRLSRIHFRKP